MRDWIRDLLFVTSILIAAAAIAYSATRPAHVQVVQTPPQQIIVHEQPQQEPEPPVARHHVRPHTPRVAPEPRNLEPRPAPHKNIRHHIGKRHPEQTPEQNKPQALSCFLPRLFCSQPEARQ